MSDDTPRVKFAYETGKVLPQIAAKSVTRILGVRKDGGPHDYRGTALVTTFGGRPVFITADHVLSHAEETGEYKCIGVSAAKGDFYADYRRFKDIDVAVIIPKTDIKISDKSVTWPEEFCEREYQDSMMASDCMLVYGFPDRFKTFSAPVQQVVSEGYTHCTWVRPTRSQAERPEWMPLASVPGYPPVADVLFDPWQFCLNFAEKSGPLKTHDGDVVTDCRVLEKHSGLYFDKDLPSGQQPFGAYGLSGSPVWRFGAPESAWSIDQWSFQSARLVGIVTNWKESLSVLTATKFEDIAKRMAAFT